MNSGLIVLLDTCILINLFHGECTDLLGGLVQYDFRITTHVESEITNGSQIESLRRLIDTGVLSIEPITDYHIVQDIELFMHKLAAGEASCIAAAKRTGCFIGTDDGLAIKIATDVIGAGRVLSTSGLIVQAIRYALITVEEADEIKARLEESRFTMPFRSFHDIV